MMTTQEVANLPEQGRIALEFDRLCLSSSNDPAPDVPGYNNA